MLRKISHLRRQSARGAYVIVASRFNGQYVDSMLRAARLQLRKSGVRGVQVVRVPGAFEIPVVAARVARYRVPPPAAILCFGVIFRGETTHAQHIGEAVSHALAKIQVECGVPILHGVYLFENVEQAKVRCLDKRHNRGIELAQTAVEMANVTRSLPGA